VRHGWSHPRSANITRLVKPVYLAARPLVVERKPAESPFGGDKSTGVTISERSEIDGFRFD
jgi:hypothetical protein